LFKKENKSFEELSSLDKKDVENKLSKNEYLIFRKIKNNSNITAKELSALIGINIRNIQKNIEKLKAKKMIKRIGSDKGGYWKIID
jgi:ATP-dependent DNA helicase RecG